MIDEKKIEQEHKRLTDLLQKAEVPAQQQAALAAVIDNLAWMKVKLDDTRELMKNAQVVCKYNNGGGQSGTRENPIYKGYTNLFRTYMIAFEKYSTYLPKDLQAEAAAGQIDILTQVRAMKAKQ